MATRAYEGAASAPPDLAAVLAAIPSLPRPILSRLTARLIDRLDEIDGDPDLEDSETASSLVDARGRFLAERRMGDSYLPANHLDPAEAEDDDPGGGDIVDEPHDQDEPVCPDYGVRQVGLPLNLR